MSRAYRPSIMDMEDEQRVKFVESHNIVLRKKHKKEPEGKLLTI
jgi:hypothetical protein